VTAPARGPVQDAKEWERLVPGSAAKIWAEQSAQLTHIRRVETAQIALQFFGPILGAVVVLVSLFVGVWLIFKGHTSPGALIATIDLVGFFLALIFLLRGRPSD
jgi:ABC-type bacteriocin/lantibiotic exporter with double-glycine peptidase domain